MEEHTENGRFLRVMLTAVGVALAVLSCGIDVPWYLIAASVVTLGLTCLSLYYISDRFFYFGVESKLLPLIYLLLLLSSPDALSFSKYHLLSLGLIWTIYFNVRLQVEEDSRFSSLFFMELILTTIVLFEPVMIWLLLILLMVDLFSQKNDFFRFFCVALAGIVLPVFYLAAAFFVLDQDIAAYLDRFTASLADVRFTLENYPMVSLFYILVLLVTVVKAYLTVYREEAFISVVSDRAFKRISVFMLGLTGIYSMYFLAEQSQAVFLLFVPLAFSIFYYYLNKIARTEVRVLSVLLVLAIILQRVYYFIY